MEFYFGGVGKLGMGGVLLRTWEVHDNTQRYLNDCSRSQTKQFLTFLWINLQGTMLWRVGSSRHLGYGRVARGNTLHRGKQISQPDAERN